MDTRNVNDDVSRCFSKLQGRFAHKVQLVNPSLVLPDDIAGLRIVVMGLVCEFDPLAATSCPGISLKTQKHNRFRIAICPTRRRPLQRGQCSLLIDTQRQSAASREQDQHRTLLAFGVQIPKRCSSKSPAGPRDAIRSSACVSENCETSPGGKRPVNFQLFITHESSGRRRSSRHKCRIPQLVLHDQPELEERSSRVSPRPVP